MSETAANPNTNPERYDPFWFRFLEILPGATVWIALIGPFLLSPFFPLPVTLFVIIFDVYWLLKSLETAYSLFWGYRRMRKHLAINWQNLLDESLNHRTGPNDQEILDWRDIYQTVIYTTYKEEEAIIEASIRSVAEANYPKERKILVLGTEGRDSKNARPIAESLHKKYAKHFYKFIVTEHPDGIAGEVKAKGANAAWAAKELVRQVESDGIPLEHIVVTTADADCRFIPQYFQALTYMYITTPDRIQTGYQPIATFLNNIWDATPISRIMAIQTTFWQMAESIRDYRMLTFSTHAMSLRTLKDINFWCTSVVNEDSRQFHRAFFHYKGHFRAVPLFLPVHMDAVHVDSFIGTMKNLYLQQLRWAYGVEHFPYIVLESVRQRRIPLIDRVVMIWRSYIGSFSWATQSFFITVVGWLPIFLNPTFRDQVVASNFPVVTKVLLSITWIGIVVANVVSIRMLPPRPPHHNHLPYPIELILIALQWVLVPITSILFGAFTGIDSITRLMLGKYIGFRVTEKKATV